MKTIHLISIAATVFIGMTLLNSSTGVPLLLGSGCGPEPGGCRGDESGMAGRGRHGGPMMREGFPPGIQAKDLPEPGGEGAKLALRYCTQCHNLPAPGMHTAEAWLPVFERMLMRMDHMSTRPGRGRGRMQVEVPSVGEQQVLLDYLQTYALKPAAPDALGPADTPGLSLFRRTCSQCHALPDPKAHHAGEWPSVVERMRGNMANMGKTVITDDERDEILGYLKKRAP